MVSVSAAGAQQITFDPFPGIPAGVSVSYFNNTRGILSALPTLSTQSLVSAPSAVPGGGDALQLWRATENFPEYGALFSFSTWISYFSVIGNDFGGDPTTDNERVFLTAFDALGNVVACSTTQNAFAEPNLQFASVSGEDIAHVAFTWDNDLGYYALDNVAWRTSQVPEPMTATLLLSGLIGLAAAAKRRQQL